MNLRLSLLMTTVLAAGLALAAIGVNAQEPHPSAPPPPGMGMDMEGHGAPHPGMGMDMEGHAAPHPRFSAADRAAFFDAHLAGLHAGLTLTPEQEKLWPPVEAALRAGAKSRRRSGGERAQRTPSRQRHRLAAQIERRGYRQGANAEGARRRRRAALQQPHRRSEAPASFPPARHPPAWARGLGPARRSRRGRGKGQPGITG